MEPANSDKRPTQKLQTRRIEKKGTGPAVPPGKMLSRQQIVSQLTVMATKGASPLQMRKWAAEAGADPMEIEHMVDQVSRGATSGRLTATYTRTSTRNAGTGGPVTVQSTRSKSGLIWIALGVLLLGGGGYMSWQHYEIANPVGDSIVTPWWAVAGIGLVVIVKGLLDLRKV